MKPPFDITNSNKVKEFEKRDTFNPENTFKGFINRRQGRLYGCIYLTHVNGKECPQIIYSAPKQHYPFDKNDNWEFPDFNNIELYEKLDGTAIISYTYLDAEGNKYLTFKTRLTACLGKSKYGNFYALWNEMLEEYPAIEEMCLDSNYNYVFELYGQRNKILVDYNVSLDTKLLFILNAKNGDIYPPFDYEDVPTLKPQKRLENVSQEIYTKTQEELEEMVEVIDEEESIVKGLEGYVWYFLKDNKAVQIKCKPPTILEYHWSPDSISHASIYTTCYNAFEECTGDEVPSFNDIVQLLKEEFTEDKIENSNTRIKNILDEVIFEKKLQYELVEEYKKLDTKITENKGKVMRHFAELYPKKMAHRIYNLLMKYEDE